ncbi:MAG TPA: MmcQ/YjbR family DNA-binding protein [Rhizomicrobium sp.]|nr:MmcQ/YjbR family DNA-binding protein [Rhizomicrobium sp.]
MPKHDDIRKIALGFDGVAEVDHWNRPAFRTARRIFAVIRPDGLWLHLPEERKEFLFAADAQAFVKYMWGKHAEILVQPDRVTKKEIAALLREAYANALPPPKKERAAKKPPSGKRSKRTA